jgi:copper transport protein
VNAALENYRSSAAWRNIMTSRGARRLLAALLLALVLAAAPARTALAHPEIIATEPAANAELDTAPSQVRIVFNESVEAAFADGGRDPAAATTLVATLPAVGPGIYTTVWQVTGSDGHTIKGNFVFRVVGTATTPVPGTAVVPAEGTPLPAPLLPAPAVLVTAPALSLMLVALLRALMLLGTLVSIGGWIVMQLVLAPALPVNAEVARQPLRRRWRIVIWVSLATVFLATLGFLLAQTQVVAGRIDAAAVRTVLLETRLGQALGARVVLTLALGLLVAIPVLRRWNLGLAFVLGGMLLLTFSIAGHASAQPQPLWPVVADWTHLAATAVWVGGLVHLALLLPTMLAALPEQEQVRTLAGVITRFSILALGSVVTITLSGTYTALLHVSSFEQLWTTSYGWALLVKLVLFGSLLALGAYNLLIVRPRFETWAKQAATAMLAGTWSKRFENVVRAEVGLAVAVLGAVGVITSIAPAQSQSQPGPAPTSAVPIVVVTPVADVVVPATRTPAPIVPFAEEHAVADLRVALDVEPAGIGENTLRVTVRDAEGKPLDVQRVQLALEMTTMDMGTTTVIAKPAGDGQYTVNEQWLSMVGEWRAMVLVRRVDAPDTETIFIVPVGG